MIQKILIRTFTKCVIYFFMMSSAVVMKYKGWIKSSGNSSIVLK